MRNLDKAISALAFLKAYNSEQQQCAKPLLILRSTFILLKSIRSIYNNKNNTSSPFLSIRQC